MEFTVENICGLLIRSRLVAADDVKVIYQRWLGEAPDAPADVREFLQWLVAGRYVTEYQADLLARGLPDHFFLNQYKILDRLGQGCMAGVYKAAHQLGQVVAIKVLPPSRAKNPQLLSRFQREARLALRLKHPNVVRTFQVGEANGLHYLVMEYLEGETLRDVLKRRGRLPPAEGVRLVHQALLGLQHFQEMGLVHRDLKPANLMLVPPADPGQPDTTLRATLKILDVGLARALLDEDVPDNPDNQLTGEGVLLGTPDYLAPEQARDAHKADVRADIYSLGCVLYHVLTGQPPFLDSSLINLMVRHIKETPRPLKDFNPAIPDGLQQIVNWMLAKDPAQRYPTPERAAQALQVFLAAGADALRTTEVEPPMRKYLTWLETDNGGEGAAEPAPAAAPMTPLTPVPPPAPLPVANTPAAEAPSGRSSKPADRPPARPQRITPLPAGPAKPAPQRRHRGKISRHKHLPTPPSPPKPPDEVVPADVELVPVLASEKILTLPFKGLALSRRDLLMLGIGAGGVMIAGLIGMGLARLRGNKDKDNPPAPEEGGKDSN
jgi:serine/threonine protein kinase